MKLHNRVSVRQCWLLGFDVLGFFFRLLPSSFMSAGRGGRVWEMLRDHPLKLLREPSSSYDRWSSAVLSEIPGTWCLGHGEGKPSAWGSCGYKGPLQCAVAAARSLTYFLEGLEKLLTTVDDVRVDLIKGLFSCWQRCAL